MLIAGDHLIGHISSNPLVSRPPEVPLDAPVPERPRALIIYLDSLAATEAMDLDGLTALHDGEQTYRGLYANYGVADRPQYPLAEHPVVRTHPVTGKKALYVNRGFTRFLIGIPRDESDAVLAYLYQHCENPLFQCRFRWTENAIAFWDNRCAQHRAMWDYWPHTRSGNRVTVAGDKPY